MHGLFSVISMPLRSDYNHNVTTTEDKKEMNFDKAIVISWLIQTKSDRFMWQDVPNQDKLGLFDIEEGKFVTVEMLATYWSVWGRLIKKWWNNRQKPEIVTKPKKKWVPYKHGNKTYPNNEIRLVPIQSLHSVPFGTTIAVDGDTNYRNWYVKSKACNDIPKDRFLLRRLNTAWGSGFTIPQSINVTNLYKVEEVRYE